MTGLIIDYDDHNDNDEDESHIIENNHHNHVTNVQVKRNKLNCPLCCTETKDDIEKCQVISNSCLIGYD
jgi:hypothetical protein